MNKNSNNILWLDSVRAVAILGVLIIHVASPVVNATFRRHIDYWWVGNLLDSASRCAVPLFLMLSGATLLTKTYPIRTFYYRRMTRVLMPFLAWMIIYWIFRWSVLSPQDQPHNTERIIDWGISLFLHEGISKHFWYIYMILFLYLLIPFIERVIKRMNLQTISNVLLLWMVLAFAFKDTPMNMYGWSNNFGSKLLGFSLYAGYLLLGYYLTQLPTDFRKVKLGAAFVYFLTVVIASVSTFLLTSKTGKLNLSMHNYLSTVIIIQSIALFIWIKDFKTSNKLLQNTIGVLSNYSFGIYLVHIIFLGIFYDNGIYWGMFHPVISIPSMVILTLISSAGVIFILRKIPFIKFIAA